MAKRVLSLNMASRVLSLDMEATSVRLMETKGGKVMNWASVRLKPGIVKDGVVLDPQALGAIIRQLMSSSGIKGRNIVASVSGMYSLNRILKRTSARGGLLTTEAVQASAQEIMPFSIKKMYLSWGTIPGSNGGEQIFLVGVPRETIDTEVQALRSAGIRSFLLCYETQAIARAVNKAESLILNIGSDSFDIIIVAKGLPEILHTRAWKPDKLTMEERVEYLAVNLEAAVIFYNSRHPEALLSAHTPLVILERMTGQQSTENLTLKEKLQALLEYPSEPIVPPLECPAHMSVSEYAVNIGLSAKKTVPSKNPLNGGYLAPYIDLLPEIYRPWSPSARQIFFFCLIMGLIVLLSPLYRINSDAVAETASAQATYNAISDQLQQKQIKIKSRIPIENAIKDYGTILDKHGGFNEELSAIMGEAGKLGIQVPSIEHGGKVVIFSAQADNYTDFRDYIVALEKSGQFFTPIKPPPEQFPYVKAGTLTVTPRKKR